MRIDEEEKIVITLNVSECTKGYYLRWINKHGEWCYYLFQGNESTEIKNSDVNIQHFIQTVDFIDGYHLGTNSVQEKNIQKSVKIYASLVDEDEFNLLISLPQSVNVDLFCGYDVDGKTELWKGVNISDGTFAKSTEILRDFEATMLLPQSFNQSL